MNRIEQLEKRIIELELEINNYKSRNQTLKETFDNSQVALEIFDPSGKLVECNGACLLAFGIKDIKQIQNYNLFDDYRIEIQKLEKIKKGETLRYELKFDFDKVHQYNLYETNKTGVYIFDCSIIPISNNNGYLVFLIDITKSKETEEILSLTNNINKEKEEILRSIIESTNDLIWTVEPINFKTQSFNTAVYNYFLKVRNVKVKIGDTTDMHTPYYKKWIEYYKKTIEQGHIEFVINIKKGLYTMYFSLNAMYKDGELFGISVFGKDITLQTKFRKEIFKKNKLLREKNKELIKSETLFRTLSESSLMGIMIYDSNGTIYVNNTLSYFSGYSKEEFIGKSPLLFIHPDDRDYYTEQLSKKKEGEINNEEYNIRGITKSGNIRDMLVLCSLARIKDNIFTIVNILDVSEKKKSEIALIKAKEKAEESDRLIVSFLRNISHEIKTPLNSINGFSQLICDDVKDNEELQLYSNIISENSEQLIDIINDVIDASNIYTNNTSLDIIQFNFYDIIEEIRTLYEKKAKEKGLEFYIITDISSDGLILNNDNNKIKRAISHLISNSIKFTNKGKIELHSKIVNNSLEIIVSDSGIGMSDKDLNIIFEPFRQTDSGTNRNYGGNGIGLYIVKSIIDLLQGNLEIQTKLGEGTTITLNIPLNI